MSRPLRVLLHEARLALHVPSQGKLGELLGASSRTGQRWERGHSSPSWNQIVQLITLVHPNDPELAAEIATSKGATLEQLGIVAPATPPEPAPAPPPAPAPAPPPPPPPPRIDPSFLVDTVVCAAAEAMQLMPEEIRPALRAAFRRARNARLTVEDLDDGLSAPPAVPQAASSSKR